jgi:hypothetical protein
MNLASATNNAGDLWQELPGKVRAAGVSALNLNDEQRRERG